MDAVSRRLNFDLLARPYRWLEYATMGRALERCRFHFLPQLTDARRALVFGDGDGRFLARLLEANPALEADVVDISGAMLRRLEARLSTEARQRVRLHQGDARTFAPPRVDYDLVVTHFFLDCLTNEELAALVESLRGRLQANARWVVSEFRRPSGAVRSLLGGMVIAGLYVSFGLLTGLPVRKLPDHEQLLQNQGFERTSEKEWLQGLLVSQIWRCRN